MVISLLVASILTTIERMLTPLWLPMKYLSRLPIPRLTRPLLLPLLSMVVPLAELEDECVRWSEEMMERSPIALRMIKAGLNAELDGQAGIQQLAGDATMLYYFLDEAQEGGHAFLEKRKPDFGQYPQIP